MQAQIIKFPQEKESVEPYENTLSNDDILNLILGVVNIVKRYSSTEKFEFLLDKLEEVHENLLCEIM